MSENGRGRQIWIQTLNSRLSSGPRRLRNKHLFSLCVKESCHLLCHAVVWIKLHLQSNPDLVLGHCTWDFGVASLLSTIFPSLAPSTEEEEAEESPANREKKGKGLDRFLSAVVGSTPGSPQLAQHPWQNGRPVPRPPHLPLALRLLSPLLLCSALRLYLLVPPDELCNQKLHFLRATVG